MIARSAVGGHVCLRCQVRLSRQLTPVNAISPVRTRHRRARQVHNDATSEISRADGSTIRRAVVKPDIIYRRVLRANRLSEHPMGRLHGYGGYRLREKHQPLAVDTLGNQSEVIVLRDSGLLYTPPPAMDDLTTEKVDIIARVEAERGLPSEAEISNNIEEVRPKVQLLSTEEFKSVEQHLNKGFTTSQLMKYLELSRPSQEDISQLDPALPPKYTIWTMGWMPGLSMSPDEFDENPLRGYVSAAYTPKQRLVLQVVRQCWNLELIEVTESLGEMELHIDALKLELLIKGKNPSLRIVSDDLISTEDEKIEAFRARGVIRITAAKEKANLIVQAIEKELRKFCSIEVDLAPLVSKADERNSSLTQDVITDPNIAELAQISGTEIRRRGKDKLEISCITDDNNLHLSTQVDVARRLLLTSSDLWHNSFSQFRFPTKIVGAVSAVKYEQTDGMPWRDRLHSWVRWVSSVKKPISDDFENQRGADKLKPAHNELKVAKARFIDENQRPFPVSMSQKELTEKHFANVVPNPRGYVYWDPTYFTTTSVIVGHVIHRTDSTISTLGKPNINSTMRFVPSALNVSRLFGKANQKQLQERTSVLMRFRPSPWTAHGAEVLTKYPHVEMRFQINNVTKNLELKDVFALAEVATSDIMVPDRGLDLRFQQRTTSRLRELHYRVLPQIKDFLAMSQLNVDLGPLKTPPNIILPIAQHLCSSESSSNIAGEAETPLDVEYLFAGLEYRSTLAVPFQNWRLLYTNIDGSKGEGRRTELSLRPRRARGQDIAHKQKDVEWHHQQSDEFINSAYDLVDALEDRDPDTTEHGPARARGQISKLKPTRNQQKDDDFIFKYFKRSITFTGAPGGERSTTPKSEIVDDEEID